MVFGIFRTLVLFDISAIETPVQLDITVQPDNTAWINFPNGVAINKYLVCAGMDHGVSTCAFQCFDISTGLFGPVKVVQSASQTDCSIRTVEVFSDFIVAGGMTWGGNGVIYPNPNNVFIWDRATFTLLRAIPGKAGWVTNVFRANNTLVWGNYGDFKFGAVSLVNVSTAPFVMSTFTTTNAHSMRWFGKYLAVYSDSVSVRYYTLKIDGNSVKQADTDQANYGYFTPTLSLVNNGPVSCIISSGVVSLTNSDLNVRDTYAENTFAYVRYTVVKIPTYLSFANTQLSLNFTNADLASGVTFIVDPTLYSTAGGPSTDSILFLASNGRVASLTVTVSVNFLTDALPVQPATVHPTTTISSPDTDPPVTLDDVSTTSSAPEVKAVSGPSNSLSTFVSQNIFLLLVFVTLLLVVFIAGLVVLIMRNKARSVAQPKGYESSEAPTNLGTTIMTSQIAGTDMKTVGNTTMPMAFPAYLDIESQDVRPIRKIGGGGAGSVFEAQLLNPELIRRFGCEKVALKVMDRVAAHATNAFQNEMIIMANFAGSRNIATVYGFLESTNSLVMKLYQETMGNWCIMFSARKDFMVTMPSLVRDVANGLAELHAKKICHNDIKPANILVEQQVDGSLVAVLTDFGIASFLETDMEVKALKPVLVKGLSLCYASPECLISFQTRTLGAVIEPEVAFARDIYALAMTSFECLCGNPFPRNSEQEIMGFIGNGLRPSFDTPVVPTLTDSPNWTILVDLIEKCWAQDPRDRPTAAFIAKYLN